MIFCIYLTTSTFSPIQRCTSRCIFLDLPHVVLFACDGVNIQLFFLQRSSFSSVVDMSHLYRGMFWPCFCHLVPFCNSEYLSFNLPYQQTPQNWVKFYPAFLPWGGFHTFSKLIQTSSTCQSNQFSLGERKDGWLFGRLADRGGQSKNLANPSKLLASGGKNLVNLAMITAGGQRMVRLVPSIILPPQKYFCWLYTLPASHCKTQSHPTPRLRRIF